LSVIDIVFVVFFGITVVYSTLRGFVREVTGFAALLLGVLFSLSHYRSAGAFIRTKILSDVQIVPEVLGFLALFTIVFLIINFVGGMLRDIVDRAGLEALNHLLGAVFGLLKGAVLLSAIIFAISVQPLFDGGALLGESKIARLLAPGERIIQKTLELRNV
jgi:membrane protein required for colicin V production